MSQSKQNDLSELPANVNMGQFSSVVLNLGVSANYLWGHNITQIEE